MIFPRVSDSACPQLGPRICISNKFLSKADAAGPGTTLPEPLLWVTTGEEEVENIQWHVCEYVTIKFAGDCCDLEFLFNEVGETKKHSMYSCGPALFLPSSEFRLIRHHNREPAKTLAKRSKYLHFNNTVCRLLTPHEALCTRGSSRDH